MESASNYIDTAKANSSNFIESANDLVIQPCEDEDELIYTDLSAEYIVEKTDQNLQKLSTKIFECNEISRELSFESYSEYDAVENLLLTVKQVQTDYQSFKNDITEIKKLQKQLKDSLEDTSTKVQASLQTLRSRMIANNMYPVSSKAENLLKNK